MSARPAAILSIRIASIAALVSACVSDQILPGASRGFGIWQTAAVLLAAAGFLLTSGRLRRFAVDTLPVLAANTLLMLLLVDAAAFLIVRSLSRRAVTPGPDAAPAAGVYGVQAPPACFHPFVFCRLEPLRSDPGFRTDSLGFRITPGAVDPSACREVYVYGGSTVLGWALPDSATIPALLQELLREDAGMPVNVLNRGMATRNSTQSMIEFLLDLQAGRMPGAAVFYEGYNDGATAWFEADPGSHLGRRRAVELFRARRDAGDGPPRWRPSLLVVADMLAGADPAPAVILEGSSPLGRTEDPADLASRTMDVYESNCRQIRAIAAGFGIPVLLAWQPCPACGTRALSAAETSFLQEMDPGEVEYQRILGDSSRSRAERGLFVWMGDAADASGSDVYIDYCHMNANGNSIIASALAAGVEEMLGAGAEPPAGGGR